MSRRRYTSGDVLLEDQHFLSVPPSGYSTAMLYLRVDGDWNTRVYLYNYWSWNYNLNEAQLNVYFTNHDGKIILSRAITVPPHGHCQINAKSLLEAEGVTELEGEASFQVAGAGLNPENPVQLIADYHYGNGISSVHGQGGLVDYGFSQRMHQIAVREDEEWSTSFDLKNHYVGEERLGGEVLVELFNARGEKQTTEISIPPKCAGVRYEVRQLFPDSAHFLASSCAGHLRVTAPYKMHRLFYMQANKKTGAHSVNHGTVEHNHNYPEWTGIPASYYRECGYTPVTVAPVVLAPGLRSEVTLVNTMGPPAGDRVIRIDIYPAEGGSEPVMRHEVELPIHCCTTVAFASLLGTERFLGHATMSVRWRSGADAYPRQVDSIPAVLRGGCHAATTIGSGAFNVSGNDKFFRPASTRIFGRMLSGDDWETDALIVYPTCGHDSPPQSSTEVALIREDGGMLKRELSVPRNGCWMGTLHDLFPEVRHFVTSNSCTLRLWDPKVRLLAFHIDRSLHGDGIAMDHFFGG